MQAIVSPRLRLVPLSLDDAAAMLEGSTPPGADWAAGYPSDATLVAAAIVTTAAAEGRVLAPWCLFQVQHEGRVVAGMGFVEGLDAQGAVQIGFSETDEAREKGLTAEGLAALIAYAREQGAGLVRAEAGSDAVAEVLREAGMEPAETQGGITLFVA